MGLDSKAKDDALFTEVEALDGRRAAVRLTVNPRARNISIRIDPTRRIAIATAPSSRQLKRAAQFAADRAAWIVGELARLPHSAPLLPGVNAPLRGVTHELAFERGRSAPRIEPSGQENLPPRLIVPAPEVDLFEARLLRFFKAEARADLSVRVSEYAAALGVRPSRLTVKETRSRWGSCTTDGALSFSWRVILAPPFVLDYLAAHETAHLVEMNHSRRFWAQVKKALPSFERGRDWLHAHGAALHAIGAA